MDGAGGGGEKPLPLGSPAWGSSAWGSPAWCSQAWGSQGLGFWATGTGCQHVLCAPLWAGGEGSRLPALSRAQYLGLGHTGKRCHLQLLRRQSWQGDGRCRGPPARSAFPPSPLSPASPECVPSLGQVCGTSPGLAPGGSEGRCAHCVPFQGMDPVRDILFSTLKVSFCGSKPCIFKKEL